MSTMTRTHLSSAVAERYCVADITKAAREYLETALWSTEGDDGASLDTHYGLKDFSASAMLTAFGDIVTFLDATLRSWRISDPLAGVGMGTIGRELWYARNHRGVWREWSPKLASVAEAMGPALVEVNTNGQIELV